MEMELHMINIIYAALPMGEQTEKTTFSCKDDYCKTVHLHFSGVKGLVHWRSTRSAGHIPGIFPLHAAYSALRHFFQMPQKVRVKTNWLKILYSVFSRIFSWSWTFLPWCSNWNRIGCKITYSSEQWFSNCLMASLQIEKQHPTQYTDKTNK